MVKKCLIISITALFCTINLYSFSEDDITEIRSNLGNIGDREIAIELHYVAYDFHLNRDYINSYSYWLKAIQADPSWEWGYYNLACSSALLNEYNLAFKYIEIALELSEGEMIFDMLADPDFESLMLEKEFWIIVYDCFKLFPRYIINPYVDYLFGRINLGEDVIGLGNNETIIFFTRHHYYNDPPLGGPEQPEPINNTTINIVVVNLINGNVLETINIVSSNGSFDEYEEQFKNNCGEIVADLIYKYGIDYSNKVSSEFELLATYENYPGNSFTDSLNGISFITDSNNNIKYINENSNRTIMLMNGQMFTRILTVIKVLDYNNYLIIYRDGNGHADYHDYGTDYMYIDSDGNIINY